MLQLKKIIKAEFEDANIDEIIYKFSSHNLYASIISAIDLINLHLKEAEYEISSYGIPQISHIASSLLIKINEYLRTLVSRKKEKDKKELEYLLGGILKRLLIQITDSLPTETKMKFATAIYSSLKDTCSLYSYDFVQLIKFLDIENAAFENSVSFNASPLSDTNGTKNNQIPCYIWNNGSSNEFNFFIKMVKKHAITEEIEKFKLLFKNPSKNLAINMDEKRSVFVLQFLSCINDSGFVLTNGFGFYQVLQCHVFNFDKIFLRDNSAKRQVAAVKKKKGWKPISDGLRKELLSIVRLNSKVVSRRVSSRVS